MPRLSPSRVGQQNGPVPSILRLRSRIRERRNNIELIAGPLLERLDTRHPLRQRDGDLSA